MTQEQKDKIEIYWQQYEQSKAEYSPYSTGECYFGVYQSNNEQDKNITIIITTIDGLGEDYEIKTTINNILIEPNGNALRLTDVYERSLVMEYLKNLKKIG
jgi:hypothetical protein